MSRPINSKNTKPIALSSSNQILWDGPSIPCINLCKGDTITDVTYKLATEVCKLMEQLDPSNYNLECLDIDHCNNITFQQLFQALINQVYCPEDNNGGGNNGGGTSENCCEDLNYIPHTVFYVENLTKPLFIQEMSEPLPDTEYTVPVGGNGIYEVMFNSNVEVQPSEDGVSAISVRIEVNGSIIPITRQAEVVQDGDKFVGTLTLFKSNINLSESDTVAISISTNANFIGSLWQRTLKITKIG